jgi:hypothetical protein
MMKAAGVMLAVVGLAEGKYGDTHYGAHPTVTEAPHVVSRRDVRADRSGGGAGGLEGRSARSSGASSACA